MKPMRPLLLAQFTATSCIGTGVAPTLASLVGQRSGLRRCGYSIAATIVWLSLPYGKMASSMPWRPRRRA